MRFTVKNPAPAGFAFKIRQNTALAGFGKSKSGTTLFLIEDFQVRATATAKMRSPLVGRWVAGMMYPNDVCEYANE